MEINGKKLNLLYSVRAEIGVKKMLIAQGVDTLGDLLASERYFDALVSLAAIMSEAYAYAHEGANVVTERDIYNTAPGELNYEQLDAEIFAAMTEGQKRTVEAEPPKKKKAVKDESS